MYTQDELIERQVELEMDMHGSGISRFMRNNQRSLDSDNQSDTDWCRRLIANFVMPMADGIEAYKNYYADPRRKGKPAKGYGFLNKVSNEQAAYIAIKIIVDALGSLKFDANWLVTTIGRRIEDQVRFQTLDDAAPKYIASIKESLAKRSSLQYQHQHRVLVSSEKKLSEEDGRTKVPVDRWIDWNENDCKHIGSCLVDIFEKCVTFEGHPIIAKELRGTVKGTTCFIVATPHVTAWIERYKIVIGALAPAYGPCVVPPRDWISPFEGGYHTAEVASTMKLVKVRNKEHLRKLTKSQMPTVYKCINHLQQVKWKVSSRVLKTANELISLNLPYALPSRDIDNWQDKHPCPVPEYLAELRGEALKSALSESEWEKFTDWKQVARAKYDEESERVADYREVTRTLGQAGLYHSYQALYFVYSTDFRGRVYCQSSLISPQGNDLQKGLIKFAEGVALGERGEYWLKVQGANVWGWDKKKFSERVELVSSEEFTTMCIDIADDPITFNDWVKADEPWQFLNWCFEYADYLKHVASGKPSSDFISHIPIAMDGSCSGIQHYSAMLRDAVGGEAVNLRSLGDEVGPKDIYGVVCNRVLEKLQALVSGMEEYNGKLDTRMALYMANEWLRLGPDRSLTKKPVMTLPYGSTTLACRNHVSNWLQDMQKDENKLAKSENRQSMKVHAFGDKNSSMPLNQAESFMTSLIWGSIGEVVVSARRAMSFIKAVTSIIAKSNEALEHTTPTGFIVRQEIYQTKEHRVMTQLMGGTRFVRAEPTKDIDYHRMMNSCSPNFVHSMDASHLTFATCGFADAGLTSVAVIHDSFGTHAGNTDKLRDVLRDTMVVMYKDNNVLEQFLRENEERLLVVFDRIMVPSMGSLVLNEINNSQYAFA